MRDDCASRYARIHQPTAPPGRPNLEPSMVRASWMLGLTAIGGVVANIIGLILIRKQKVGIAFALCGAFHPEPHLLRHRLQTSVMHERRASFNHAF